ncbi:MAG: hypothetical protein N4A46_16005 [Schleiferiaceae bacterium]|jgi:hypothetical protein|nr:hypothetical protein [Schleiferiaceae bacterium]
MKTKPHEISSLKELIQQAGKHSLDFDWVKKKGVLNISENGHRISYYRKTLSEINSSGKITSKDVYSIFLHSKDQKDELSWYKVLEAFENWLKEKSS